jgi:hypothetical protein
VLHRRQRPGVALLAHQLEQAVGVGQAVLEAGEIRQRLFQARALAPQLLGPLRLFPDVGPFQLAADDDQPVMLGVEVKDTPAAPERARAAFSGAEAGD